MSALPYRIALIGNPNCGKTTIFNLLTGAQQVVGNWPGVTVEKKSGWFDLAMQQVQLIDLPGIYSLTAASNEAIDEKIALAFLQQGEYDLIINVIDAANLTRSLYLTSQLLEMETPVLLVLNMGDVAAAKNIEIATQHLVEILQAPLVRLIAKNPKEALPILHTAIQQAFTMPKRQPLELYTDNPILQEELHSLADYNLSNYWLAVQMLENGIAPSTLAAPAAHQHALIQAQSRISEGYDEDADMIIINMRLEYVNHVSNQVVSGASAAHSSRWDKWLDAVFLHKIWGLPILACIMYLVFSFSIICGGALGDTFTQAANLLFTDMPLALLGHYQLDIPILSTIIKAIGGGVAIVAPFVPVIAALYLALGILEDSGYMTRAAFLLDNILRKIGLPGKAFVPLVLGFGCNVPAIMAARTLENKQDRIATIMMVPFMSCSARLATYTLFISAFFPQHGHLILFALYMLGIALGILTGWLLRRYLLTEELAPFIVQLPDYHLPSLGNIYRRTKHRVKKFVLKAGSLIAASFVILQLTLGSLVDLKANTAAWHAPVTSLLQPIGITPDNWPAAAGIVSGIIAKEMVIGTLGALYLHNDLRESPALEEILQEKFGSPRAAIAYLIFILLYFPCISVFVVIMRELSWRWAVASTAWSTTVAYVLAVAYYQISGVWL